MPAQRRHQLAASVGVALAVGTALVLFALADGGYDVVDRQRAALILWWASLIAAAIHPRPMLPSVRGLLVTVSLAAIALWIALDPGRTLSPERSGVELARWVGHLAPIILLGWLLPRRLWPAVLYGAAAGATIITLLALGNALHPGLLGKAPAIDFAGQTARLSDPLGYWNAVGSWGVMTGLLLLAIASAARAAVVRVIVLLPVPAVAAAVYLTYSRSAVLSAAFALLVLVALSPRRWTAAAICAGAALTSGALIAKVAATPDVARGATEGGGASVALAALLAGVVLAAIGAGLRRSALDHVQVPTPVARRVAITTAVIVVVGGGALAGTFGQQAWRQANEISQNGSGSRFTELNNGLRIAQWKTAIKAWQQEPWTGEGAGTFELIHNRFGTDYQFSRDAHSAFIEALAEQGIPGLALLLALVGAGVAACAGALRRARERSQQGLLAGACAALAAFVLGTGVDWFWEVGALAALALVLLGGIVAADAAGGRGGSEPEGARTRGSSRGMSIAVRAGLIALCAIGALVQVPGLVGTSEIRRSQQAVAAGDLIAARSHADQAIDTMPWAASPFLQRALVDERAGALDSARVALRLAIKRDRFDYRLPLLLARVEAADGRPRAALAAYRAARRLAPRSEFFVQSASAASAPVRTTP